VVEPQSDDERRVLPKLLGQLCTRRSGGGRHTGEPITGALSDGGGRRSMLRRATGGRPRDVSQQKEQVKTPSCTIQSYGEEVKSMGRSGHECASGCREFMWSNKNLNTYGCFRHGCLRLVKAGINRRSIDPLPPQRARIQRSRAKPLGGKISPASACPGEEDPTHLLQDGKVSPLWKSRVENSCSPAPEQVCKSQLGRDEPP
jgi:hypothetical protein